MVLTKREESPCDDDQPPEEQQQLGGMQTTRGERQDERQRGSMKIGIVDVGYDVNIITESPTLEVVQI